MQEEEVLGCRVEEVMKFCPHFVCGFDQQHRPYIFQQLGTLNVSELLSKTPLERIVRHHIWEQEKTTQLLFQEVSKLTHLAWTICFNHAYITGTQEPLCRGNVGDSVGPERDEAQASHFQLLYHAQGLLRDRSEPLSRE